MTCEYCYGDAMNTPIICMPTLKVNVRVRNSDFDLALYLMKAATLMLSPFLGISTTAPCVGKSWEVMPNEVPI